MLDRRAFLISISLSLLSMYLVYQYISSEDERMQRDYGTFQSMVVASRDVLQYQTIRPSDLEVIRVPNAMVPPGLLADPKDVIDSVASIPISKGEFILDNKIISKNVYSGLDMQLTLGRRAISLPVTVKTSVGNMLRPGNRIDLATYFEYKSGATNINELKVFMQDVMVLAVGKTIQTTPPKGVDQDILRSVMETNPSIKNKDEVKEMIDHVKTDTSFTVVTLEVTPQQAQVLVYVMTVFGDAISLMLRHSDDRILERRATTNLFDVMGPDSYLVRGKKAPPPRAVPRPKFFDLQGGQQVPVMN